jgi:hypothetical protein
MPQFIQNHNHKIMLQIKNTLVSLDLIESFFVCDLDTCLGECCIEGDAGAPITKDEYEHLCKILPEIYDDLNPAAQKILTEQGPGYYDEDGDLVTSIVDGRDCVFTCYAPGGKCLCALEKAQREGRIPPSKPISCHLYPIRLKQYDSFTAVNYHRWKICKCAETLGRAKQVRVYQFLREPLIRHFGQEWYDELDFTAKEYLKQK